MPELRFYNTLTHRIEPFEPLTPPVVRMYTCGPTVYDFAHIGNFRSFLFADVLRRLLELVGCDVRHVMNITDVGHMTDDAEADGAGEDKMELAARRLAEAKKGGEAHAAAMDDPRDPFQIARFYTDAFLEDARKLRMKVAEEYPASMPHATANVEQMLAIIERLIEKGHAYVGGDGAVYFSVESFPEYGRLSGNTIEQLRGGAGGRVAAATQAAKRHPADFLLWKPDEKHIMKWPSRFGTGYPGWHIECSAMAMAHLGAEVIDIHTGGEDNIFPHHECEIAQSRGATGREHFARYWLHGRHLRVEGRKMSKSRGNFHTVRDVLEGRVTGREVHPAALRLELIKTHYRASSNFTAQGLHDSGRMVARLQKLRHAAAQAAGSGHAAHAAGSGHAAHAAAAAADPPAHESGARGAGSSDPPRGDEVTLDHPVLGRFTGALADDLNMSEALAAVFEWVGELPEDVSGRAGEILGVLEKVDSVLGVIDADAAAGAAPGEGIGDDVAALARQIDEARARKDFSAADSLRDRLLEAGYKVQTTREGTVVEKPLA